MTVQTEISRSGPYAGAGTTGPFTVRFRFLADSHLRVIRTGVDGVDSDLVLATDYSVTGAGNDTGTVTLAVALPIGATLTIIRNAPFTQEADYVDNDSFPAESHETALDLLTMQTQQIKEAQDRAIALSPTSDAGVSTELPAPIANNLLAWNPSADALRNLDPSAIAGVVSYGTFLAETFDGTGAQVDFVVTGNPLTIGNLDVSVDGVVQTAGKHFTFVPPSTVRFITGAPAAGTDNVLIRYGSSLAMGEAAGITGQTAIGTALITALDAAAARDAIDAVPANGESTIYDVKTFDESPIVPTPTGVGDAANKGYIDSLTMSYSGSGASITATGTTLTSSSAGKAIDINSASATSTTLMAISSLADGQTFSLTNIGSGVATFNRAGSDTITGGNLLAATSISLNKGETVTLSRVNGSFRVTSSNVSFFGPPRTWQNLTGSRASGTNYTNSTGRDINIIVRFDLTTSANSVVIVNGLTVSYFATGTVAGMGLSHSVLIPSGATYSASGGSLSTWVELR